MNLTESIAPRSDQINADDLIAAARTVTITEVRAGSPEQPVHIITEEFGPERPYKPSKSMRRVIVSAWGADSSSYAGRQLTLFRNPTIRFGKDEVGGIQISHLSHISEPLRIALTVTRGKRSPFTVQPLTSAPVKDTSGRDWLTELADAAGDPELIGALGVAAKNAGAQAAVLAVIRQAYKDAKTSEQAVTIDTKADER